MDLSVSVLIGWACSLVAIALVMSVSLAASMWKLRSFVAWLVMVITIVPVVLLVFRETSVDLSVVVVYIATALLTVFYGFRLARGRLDEELVRKGTLRDSIVLLLASTGLPLSQLVSFNEQSAVLLTYAFLAVTAGLAIFLAIQAVSNVRKYRMRPADIAHQPKHLPSVTLAIPARNETHELAYCLDAALASNYPKLEIIVLDDCSQDRTSELIRAYAQSGVRFIKGKAPSSGWLGKNNAYEELLEQSSGSIIVFAGVDTRLKPGTISELVVYAEKTKADMVSVLPQQREDYLAPSLLPGLKHVWEVTLPELAGRVPVATACWLVRRDTLLAADGFEHVRADILPERRIASLFSATHKYRYVIASGNYSPTHGKKWSSLVDSSVRLLYPSLKREPLLALLASICLLAIGTLPFVLAVTLTGIAQLVSIVSAFALIITYAVVLKRLHPRMWWLGVWLLPLVVIQEAVMVIVSMVRYEFMSVNWKGRNVCYPVMSRKSNF